MDFATTPVPKTSKHNASACFIAAITDNNQARVQDLLDSNMIDILTWRDDDGDTALIVAAADASNDLDDIMRILLDAAKAASATASSLKDFINTPDKDGFTPLTIAASRGREETVHELLEAGASVDAKDSSRRTALMWAVKSKGSSIISIISKLVAKSSYESLAYQDMDGNTAIHLAVNSGNSAVFAALTQSLHLSKESSLEKRVALLNKTNGDGYTPLILAAKKFSTDIITMLIDEDVSINERDHFGRTALMHAIHHTKPQAVRHVEHPSVETQHSLDLALKTVELLLKEDGFQDRVAFELGLKLVSHLIRVKGTGAATQFIADSNLPVALKTNLVNLKTNSGLSLLMIACLADKGSNFSTLEGLTSLADQDKFGLNALTLYLVFNNNKKKTIQRLVNIVNLDQQDALGRTPLMLAVLTGNEAAIKTLLPVISESNLNSQSVLGFTALMYAVFHRQINVIEILSKCEDLNVVLRNKKNMTALMLATYSGSLDMFERLLRLFPVRYAMHHVFEAIHCADDTIK